MQAKVVWCVWQINVWFNFEQGEGQICDVFINFALFPHFVSNSIWPHSTLPWQCILSNSLFQMQTMWNEDNVSALDHVENFSKYNDQIWFWYFCLIYFWTTHFDVYLPLKVLHSTKLVKITFFWKHLFPEINRISTSPVVKYEPSGPDFSQI